MTEIYLEYKNSKTDVEISNYGNVRGTKFNGHKFTESDIKIVNGRRKLGSYLIYQLVDRLFRGPLPEGYVVHHIDENKLNDRLDNLQRLTNKEHLTFHAQNMTDEVLNKRKGRTPWNKGKIGVQVAWNKGIKFSEETKEKLKLSHIGQTPWNKGKKKEIKDHWYNNGTNNIRINEGDIVPEGFVKGRIKKNG